MRTLIGFLISLPVLGAGSFSIDQVLSSPFPSDLTASPRGDAVAWVLYAKGVRNVWVAKAPEYVGRPITKFTADDGQEIDEIAWKPDASGLYFTRGGDVSARGDFPNPQSNPAGVQQEIWSVELTGDARKVGNGHTPVVNPDGSGVAWIYGGQVWTAGSGLGLG